MSVDTVGMPGVTLEEPPIRRAPLRAVRRVMRLRRAKVGAALLALIVAVAVFGPLFAPHSPSALVGPPYCPAGSDAPLGCDFLGHDVLSRVLWGGRTVLALSLAATILGVSAGVVVGLLAAYRPGAVDDVLMRILDVKMAFPPLIFALLIIAMFGSNVWLLILTVALTNLPRVARLVRGAALELLEREFISASRAIGESHWRLLLRGVLPNISGPLLAETSLRLTYSVALTASLSFVGLGLQPPAADWGLMINENRAAISINAYPVVVPVAAIALLTIGVSLIADAVARTMIGVDRATRPET